MRSYTKIFHAVVSVIIVIFAIWSYYHENTDTAPKNETGEETNANVLHDVASVVDGDTLKVAIDGKEETLRLIGMNTPETVDPRRPVQCFGREASNKAKELLSGKKINLEADPTQGERDKYGRLLRYVFLEDGTNFNQLMIAQGYAHEYTYDSNPYKYQKEFKEAEKAARADQKGLWSKDTCAGNTDQAAKDMDPSKKTTKNDSANPVASAENTVVKKSSSDICHEPGTMSYPDVKKFTPYDTIEQCLQSGGRLPKK